MSGPNRDHDLCLHLLIIWDKIEYFTSDTYLTLFRNLTVIQFNSASYRFHP